MLILGIDSSDDYLAAGLACPDGVIISRASDKMAQGKNVLHGFLDDLFHSSGYNFESLKGVAISIGPGSFTGLRVGLAVAKGICWSLNLPLAGVSSLLALAYCADKSIIKILTVKDARQNEYYYGGFLRNGDSLAQIIPDSIGPADKIASMLSDDFTPVGPGVPALMKKIELINEQYSEKYDKQALGGIIANLGIRMIQTQRVLDISSAIPEYVRNPKPKEWNL